MLFFFTYCTNNLIMMICTCGISFPLGDQNWNWRFWNWNWNCKLWNWNWKIWKCQNWNCPIPASVATVLSLHPCVSNCPLRWRHNELDGVSDHQPHDCLLNRLFGRRSKRTSKLRVTGLCAGNSPGTGEFSAQMASNAENVSIWWRHHVWVNHGHHRQHNKLQLQLSTLLLLIHYLVKVTIFVDFGKIPNNADIKFNFYHMKQTSVIQNIVPKSFYFAEKKGTFRFCRKMDIRI